MKASDIAHFLHATLHGTDIEVTRTGTLDYVMPQSLLFAKKYSQRLLGLLSNATPNCLAIVVPEYKDKLNCSYILSNNPRLDFIRIVSEFFTDHPQPIISPTAVISPQAKIGAKVAIGDGCVIGNGVSIGEDCILFPNVTITGNVTIGRRCIIKSGTVIGQFGFGFERDEAGIPVHFPHTGGVRIGDDVSIGANCTIDRATLGDTIIEDHVKIDNKVQIAHNCHIKSCAMLAGGCSLAGGVTIGRFSWVSPNVTIYQHLSVGEYATVGMGSVVLRKIKDYDVVFGVPAEVIDTNRKEE